MAEQVKLFVVGAGSRGTQHASYALKHPNLAEVVAVAEPREFYRNRMVETYDIPNNNVFTDWRQALQRERLADAVIIATQDSLHEEPAIALARKGYHMLLEKPMAPTAEGCRRIVSEAIYNKIIFAVCHVLRYTDYTRRLKSLIDSGMIGKVESVQHLEPVCYWHYAHSFVRGNWRKESESSFMLLAKSCHDLDWIRYIVGAKCKRVSSFGSLSHFRKDHKPTGAANRCLYCSVEPNCPYSAKKLYLGMVAKGDTGWPVSGLTPNTTVEGVTEALRTGPYGRCVYECDNDVVDHQVVNMEFEGGQTASFTMVAFTEQAHRKTRVFGTRGMIEGDGSKIARYDFLRDETIVIDTLASPSSITGGHGGGDYRLMEAFVEAVGQNNPSRILSGPHETLETHLSVFAAEKARHDGTVENVELEDMS